MLNYQSSPVLVQFKIESKLERTFLSFICKNSLDLGKNFEKNLFFLRQPIQQNLVLLLRKKYPKDCS